MPYLLRAAAMIVTLSSCGTQTSSNNTSDMASRLSLTEWNGVSIEQIAVTLTDTEITGRAHCNRFHATISFDESNVAIGPIASTRMACDLLQLESEFLQQLQTVSHRTITSDGATLETPDGKTFLFQLRPQP
jgi:heat shock protein HslJ